MSVSREGGSVSRLLLSALSWIELAMHLRRIMPQTTDQYLLLPIIFV